jgi:hypothetical protein
LVHANCIDDRGIVAAAETAFTPCIADHRTWRGRPDIDVLRIAVTGSSIVLPPMQFAAAAQPGEATTTQSITGHLDPGAADWVYLPVDVPAGVRQIDVSYTYDEPARLRAR